MDIPLPVCRCAILIFMSYPEMLVFIYQYMLLKDEVCLIVVGTHSIRALLQYFTSSLELILNSV